jgi:hypothetical protein
MANEWFYARGTKRMGPFSPRQFKDLADAGTIVPSDTVWKDDLKVGVLASRVRNLFVRTTVPVLPVIEDVPLPAEDAASTPVVIPIEKAPAEATPAAVVSSDKPPSLDVPESISLVPLEPAAEPKAPKKKPPEQHVKKGRATAVKGADIVSQDGVYARYRKKCTKCDHKDSACHSVLITNKMFKTNYFCPKCRKGREVAIQCSMQ